MANPLNVLLIEDSENDASLIIRLLRSNGLEITHQRVDTVLNLRRALKTCAWDVILCDHLLPGDLDSLKVLDIVKTFNLDIPFIIVSGEIDNKTAVEAMRRGAHDFVLKENLTRLAPAIKRELQECRNRQEQKTAEIEIQKKNQDLSLLHRLNKAVNHGDSFKKIFALFSRDAREVFNANCATIYTLSDDKSTLDIHHLNIPPSLRKRFRKKYELDNHDFKIRLHDQSIYQKLLAQRNPQIINDIDHIRQMIAECLPENLGDEVLCDIHRITGIKSVLVAPLVSAGEVLGLIDISRKTAFDKEDLQRLETLAGEITTILKRRQLEEECKNYEGESIDLARCAEENPSPVLRVSKDGTVLFTNLAGKPVLDAWRTSIGGNVPESIYQNLRHALDSGEIQEQEYELEDRLFIFKIVPVVWGDYANLYGLDITDRRKAEQSQRESELKYRTLIEQSNDAIYLLEDGKFTIVNDRFTELLGVTPEEVRAPDFNFTALISPKSIPLIQERQRIAAAGGEPPRQYEFTGLTKSGKEIELEASVTYIDNPGKITVQGILHDITERKLAEAAIKEHQALLTATIESTADSILVVDENGQVTHLNQRFAKMWRIPQKILKTKDDDKLLGFVLKQLIDPDQFLKKVKELYQTDKTSLDTLDFKDGRCFERYSCPLIKEGKVAGRVWSFRDVTDQKAAEKALRESEEKFRKVVDNQGEGVGIVDPEDRFIFANPAAEKIFGVRKGKLDNRLISEFLDAKNQSIAKAQTKKRRSGKTNTYELSITRKDGEIRHLLLTGTPRFDDHGNWTGTFAIFRDITERKKADEALRKSEKRFNQFMQTITDVIYRYDPRKNRYDFISPSVEVLSGYCVEEHQADPSGILNIIIHADDLPEVKRLIDKQYGKASANEVLSMEYRVIKRSGEIIWVRDRRNLELDSKGSIYRVNGVVSDITQRKRTEDELVNSERRFQDVARATGDFIWEVDKDFRYVFASGRVKEILGYEPEEIIGKTPFDFMPEDEADQIRKAAQKYLKQGKPITKLENWNLTKDGRRVCLLTNGVITRNEAGEILGYRGLDVDITQEKKYQETLKESEEKYRSIFENILDVFYKSDTEGKLELVSPSCLSLFGADNIEELIGKNIAQEFYYYPEQRQAFLEELSKNGKVVNYPLILKNIAGDPVPVETSSYFVYDNEGNIKGIEGVLRDVTDRLAAEEAIRSSEERHRQLIETMNDGMAVQDTEGVFTYVNDVFCRMLGHDREEILGQPADNFLDEENLKAITQETEKRKQGEQESYELVWTRKDGSKIHTTVSPARLTDNDGNFTGSFAVITDITERKKMEKALQEAVKFQKRILDTAATAIFTVDNNFNITSVNQAFCANLGYEPDEVVGEHCSILLGHPCLENCNLFDPRRTEPIVKRQCTVQTKEGRRLSIFKNAEIIYDELGNVTGGVESFVDVTDLIEARLKAEITNKMLKESNHQLESTIKYAKEMARQAEQSSNAKSEFLANMSHEMRTPLNGILGFAQLMSDDRELTDEQRESIDTIYNSGSSLLDLINDILDFSKIEAGKMDLDRIEFDLIATVENVCHLLAHKADKKHLNLNCHIDPETPDLLMGDPGRIRQVLLNLLGNAIKFTNVGEINLTTNLIEQSETDARIKFTVKDTGIGIPEERQAAIFDSFTQADGTTTRKYGGTGLGLAISQRLVALMGGQIQIQSTIAEGSTFSFDLKLVKSPNLGRKKTLPISDLQGLNVLIVEDNRTNREFMLRMLSNWHIKPVAVERIDEALAEINERGPYPLILIDGKLPDGTGFELAEQIRHAPLTPQPKLILLTSTGQRDDTMRCQEIGIEGYLMKPIRQMELLDAINSVLSEAEPGSEDQHLIAQPNLFEERSQYNILLAEDNPVNQRLAIRMLEKNGHSVTLAENGDQVLKHLESAENHHFDLILMDVQMPILDGLEATAQIRKIEAETGGHIPIIAMTAHAMKGDRERCISSGMDDYVSKPIKINDLIETIEAVIIKSNAARENRLAQEDSGPATNSGAPILDLDLALERVGGEADLLKELAEIFLEDYQNSVRDIQTAIDNNDAASLEHAAHSLKGSVANFGAAAVVDAAFQLEKIGREGQLDSAAQMYETLTAELDRLVPLLSDLSMEEMV